MEQLLAMYEKVKAKAAAKKAWLQTEEGKEYNRMKARQHYERHREKVLESRRLYYEANKDMMRERNRIAHQKWREQHPEKYAEQRERAKQLRTQKQEV